MSQYHVSECKNIENFNFRWNSADRDREGREAGEAEAVSFCDYVILCDDLQTPFDQSHNVTVQKGQIQAQLWLDVVQKRQDVW